MLPSVPKLPGESGDMFSEDWGESITDSGSQFITRS